MKTTILSILFAVVLIGGAILFTSGNRAVEAPIDNVSIVDGKQIIDIRVKGGYQPRKTMAKAGLPTIIRFNSASAFDCSLAVRVPSLSWGKMLPSTGVTDLDIGTSTIGKLNGTCSMGMYYFEVEFTE